MSDKKKTRIDIDMLKGLSIIAVILYHIGIVQSGYLGVDCFFVINGFLLIPALCEKINHKNFSYVKFLWTRLTRLYPVLVIGCIASLILGMISMIPDDFENLNESIVASLLFGNNFLQGYTLRNYWNTLNIYRPLMHTWYLGILMQFYIVIPIIVWFIRKCSRKRDSYTLQIIGLIVLSIVSLVLFLQPAYTVGQKFYYIPFRFYEIALGGILGMYLKKQNIKTDHNKKRGLCRIVLIVLLVIVYVSSFFRADFRQLGNTVVAVGEKKVATSNTILPNEVLVILSVIITLAIIFVYSINEFNLRENILSFIGKRSYSLFIWHQILLAFYRYYFAPEINAIRVVLYLLVTLVVAELSYRLIEMKNISSKKREIGWIITAFLISLCSVLVYFNAGVIRDVPELGIKVNDVHKNMHAEYNDKVFERDTDFTMNSKRKVLVIGNSFGRDWVNVLSESIIADELEISYIYKEPLNCEFDNDNLKRIRQSEYIFVFMGKSDLPKSFWREKGEDVPVYGIGTKTFGQSNGAIYVKRLWLSKDDYFSQTIKPNKVYEDLNLRWKEEWGESYIDLMNSVREKDGLIRVFTTDNKLISQDCRHLTKSGAEYFARTLQIENYFK